MQELRTPHSKAAWGKLSRRSYLDATLSQESTKESCFDYVAYIKQLNGPKVLTSFKPPSSSSKLASPLSRTTRLGTDFLGLQSHKDPKKQYAMAMVKIETPSRLIDAFKHMHLMRFTFYLWSSVSVDRLH